MAGEKATLKAALLAAFNAQINVTTAQPTPITQLSEAQAAAIVDIIIAAIDGAVVTNILVAGPYPVTGTTTLKCMAT